MNTPEFVSRMKMAAGKLAEARDLVSQGPLDYYLNKLVEHSEALLTKFAPLKVGDRARIVAEIKCEDGWLGCDRTLAIGQSGFVEDVDYRKGRFVVDFVPDEQWWRDGNGRWHSKDRKHRYCLSADKLERIEPPSV